MRTASASTVRSQLSFTLIRWDICVSDNPAKLSHQSLQLIHEHDGTVAREMNVLQFEIELGAYPPFPQPIASRDAPRELRLRP